MAAAADGIQAYVDKVVQKLPNEDEDQQSDAVRQYLSKKIAWISPNEEQFDALVKLLKKRLDEGHGETILEIGTGVADGECPGLLVDEMEASVATMKSMQAVLDSEVQLLREKLVSNNTRYINEYLIRRHIDQEDFMEGLALALGVPVFVIVTKIDMAPPNVLQETMRLLQRILKSSGVRKIPLLIQNNDDVITCATNFTSERLCPIFQVSNVTGENLDLLKKFLNLLTTRMEACIDEPAEFQIDDLYAVPGVGTVVSGTTLKGTIKLGDNLQLGPDPLGQFRTVQIRSIHRKRMPVKECKGGQTSSFALRKIRKSELRKGMVLLSPAIPPVAYWEFEADLLILHHPTTISTKYQAMVHCGSIRQTATIITMSVEHLRTGDRANVRFRFIKSPEYLRVGMKLVFREGRTKAIGSISKLYPHVPTPAPNTRGKTRSQALAGSVANTITTDQSQPSKRTEVTDDTNRSAYKRTKQTTTTTTTTTTTAAPGDQNNNNNVDQVTH
ncbi:unnamed protein product [Rotaria socialis]|uniref:Translation elongation factor EFTu-like domain-containing protein n=1 Tax=Rotaria socialis TaxID=392032 RepID=A0A820BAG6_9BILA|nr:unnamed protein product [Rotaria socialis]